ncbi:hypothetical protein EFE25_07270 [Levilactobacillus brevis]|nr:hypothetical protein S101106_01750 [Levilactobacillus brevis]MCS8597529.1 hypothetical protein [Levilactobacillus brevis]MCT3564246.1 hypothetical protein [Levilactobacillus brevis]QCZ51249.1 Hypothetical protein SAC12_1680 [Levilactobacillus brevis]
MKKYNSSVNFEGILLYLELDLHPRKSWIVFEDYQKRIYLKVSILIHITSINLFLSDNVILHSDQESTHMSLEFFDLARQKGITRSIFRKGMSADNPS